MILNNQNYSRDSFINLLIFNLLKIDGLDWPQKRKWPVNSIVKYERSMLHLYAIDSELNKCRLNQPT